jgi:hypothetical protein
VGETVWRSLRGAEARTWGRTLFAAAWILGQLALVVTADARPDHAFGFRMFQESSTIHVHLAREVDAPSGHGTITAPVEGGTWVARDREGTPHRFAWKDRVHEPALAVFDRTFHASYGADAQVARLQAALDDVAANCLSSRNDAETRGLVLEVTVRKNGRDPKTVTMRSPSRLVVP